MLKFKSLTAKFIFIPIILLICVGGYIYAGFIFTHHTKSDATRINIAGRQRMLMRSIGYNVMSIVRLSPFADRDSHLKLADTFMSEYEEALYGLRDGSEKFGLKPVSECVKEVILEINALIELWQKTQKPTIINVLNLPLEKKNETCGKCHTAIRNNLPKIEAFVKSLEKDYEKEIRDFDAFRYCAFGFFFIAAVFIIFYIRQSIIKPV